jgi:uncharacterized repeat protein (TIGR01451 family)
LKKLSLFLLILFGFKAKANHILGADITYKCIDTNSGKYRFRVSLYRDCSDIAFTNEVLEIRRLGFSGNIPLIFQYKEEVTPLCQVPDVTTNPISNCPNGATGANGIKGVERNVYEVDYVMGKNIGYAYVAWTACCRNSQITTISFANASPVWVQALVNTGSGFFNNTPIYTSNPIPYWCRLQQHQYNLGAIDSFDDKMIWVNNQYILKDSLVYRLYCPFTGENNSNIEAPQPCAIFNINLSPINFLYTTTGVQFDQKIGTITATPSVIQEAVYAIAVLEYRAIPNPNGIGYTRKLAGYTARDMQFTVRDLCSPINFIASVFDTNNIPIDGSNFNFKTKKLKGNKFQFKVEANSSYPIKLKDKSSIDTNSISNYTLNYSVNSYPGNIDTLVVNLDFDFNTYGQTCDFIYSIYYCTPIGQKIEMPIVIKFKQDSIWTIIPPVLSVKGKLYLDKNQNCLYETNTDSKIPNYKFLVLNLTENTHKYYFTDSIGHYDLKLKLSNSYQFIFDDKIICNINQNSYDLNPYYNDTIIQLDFPFSSDKINYRLTAIKKGMINLTSKLKLIMDSKSIDQNSNLVKNYTVTLPPKSYFSSIIPNSFSTSGNQIKFSSINAPVSLELVFDSLVVSDTLCFHIKMDKVADEIDTTDNETTLCLLAFTSYDPNHKLVAINSQISTTRFTNKSDALVYTIQFQNTGNSLARDIFILDTLDIKLDLESISILNSSHALQASLDTNRIVKFNLKNIYLPDSNSNESLSHGYVQYSIKPYPSLTLGQFISNRAAIYFDFNLPIFTNSTISLFDKTITNPEASISSLNKNLAWAYPTIIRYNEPIQIMISTQKFAISLFSIDGKKIEEWTNQKSIQLNQISKGIYVLKLETDNEILTQKIIIE